MIKLVKMRLYMRLPLLSSSRKADQECSLRVDDGQQRVEEPRALIPDVGSDQAVSAEVLTTSRVEERYVYELKQDT